MAEVKLYKKLVDYTDKDGEEKTATNFYVACGDSLIPVEVKYFEDKKTGVDPNYRGRKMVMSSYAEVLPEKEDTGKKNPKTNKSAPESDSAKSKSASGPLPF